MGYPRLTSGAGEDDDVDVVDVDEHRSSRCVDAAPG